MLRNLQNQRFFAMTLRKLIYNCTKLRIFGDELAKSGGADFTILTEIICKIYKTFRIFRQSLLRLSQLVPL